MTTLHLDHVLDGVAQEFLDDFAPYGALAFDPRGERLLVGVDQTVHAFDLRDGTRAQEYDFTTGWGPAAACQLLEITPDGRHLVGAFITGNGGEGYSLVRVLDAATGAHVAEVRAPDHLWSVALHPDGELLACADLYTVQVNRVSDGALLARADGVPLSGCTWDPSTGDLLALLEDAVLALDPRSLATRGRVAVPRAGCEALNACGVLHARATAAPGAIPGLPSLDLPWSVTLWANSPERSVLWLADDGGSAVVLTDDGEVTWRGDGRVRMLHTAPETRPWLTLGAAVSPDGRALALRRRARIDVGAIERG